MKGYIIIIGMLTCIFTAIPGNASAQSDRTILRFTSSHTAFPDEKRSAGYTYGGKFFDAASHYNDSSVMLVIPRHLKKTDSIHLVFWFHGWSNTIDSASSFYKLADQFIESNVNAVLVLAETASNAPDSYAGKFEKPGTFNALVDDIINQLKKQHSISANSVAGSIVLAGHSGAYRAIAYILQYAQLPVQEVELFDALYSEMDKFMNWIQKDPSHHFIHWYTNKGGGTDEMSVQMITALNKAAIQPVLIEESSVNVPLLQSGNVVFVHSLREHNEIISNPSNFKLLLQASFLNDLHKR